jgi:hypothetical protein
VSSCPCARFSGDPQQFLCPVCSRAYAGRTSLEIHFYGRHPGLTVRERSVLLQKAVYLHRRHENAPKDLPTRGPVILPAVEA